MSKEIKNCGNCRERGNFEVDGYATCVKIGHMEMSSSNLAFTQDGEDYGSGLETKKEFYCNEWSSK